VVGEGATVDALGDVAISGVGGVTWTAPTYETVERRSSGGWLRRKVTTTYTTHVQNGKIASSGGRVLVVSDQGNIHTQGLHVNANRLLL
jgi:hypothetical protein